MSAARGASGRVTSGAAPVTARQARPVLPHKNGERLFYPTRPSFAKPYRTHERYGAVRSSERLRPCAVAIMAAPSVFLAARGQKSVSGCCFACSANTLQTFEQGLATAYTNTPDAEAAAHRYIERACGRGVSCNGGMRLRHCYRGAAFRGLPNGHPFREIGYHAPMRRQCGWDQPRIRSQSS